MGAGTRRFGLYPILFERSQQNAGARQMNDRDQSSAAQLAAENERLREELASLRAIEQRFRTTLYAIGDGVIATDASGRVTQMNKVAEALTGWSEAEARGKPAADVFRVVNEKTGAPVESPIDRVLREGIVVGLANHTVLVARDGSQRPIADSGAPIRESDGKVTGVVLVFNDQSVEREAKAELIDAEERFRTFFDYAPIGKCMTAPDGTLLRVNPAFGQMLGYSSDEIQAISFAAITHPDDIAASKECVRCLLAGEQETWAMEKRYLAKGGNIVWTHVTTRLLRDSQGKPLHFLTHIQNITDQKRVELDLRERVKELTCLQQLGRFADGDGATLDDILEMSVQILPVSWLHTESAVASISLDDNVYATGAMEQCLAVQTADLRVRGVVRGAIAVGYTESFPEAGEGPFLPEERALLDAVAGRLGHLIERFEYEAELRKSEERLRRITEAAPDMIYCMSLPEGRYEYVNPVAERIFGYTANDFIENPLLIKNAIHPDWHGYFADEWRKLLADEAPPIYEYPIVHKNGETRWLNQRNVVMRDEDGTPNAIWGIVTDITQARRDHENLLASKREIEIRDRIARAFLSCTDDELYGRVLDVVLEALDSTHGLFGYIDQTGALIVPTITGRSGELGQVDDRGLLLPRDQWGDSIGPRALGQREILLANERSELTPAGDISVDRTIAAPLIVRDDVIGLLQVGGRETDYTDDDRARMQTICDAIAPVLRRRLQAEREKDRRRRVETELLRERDFLNTLLDALPGVFYVLDAQGRFLRWNENFARVAGYSGEEFAELNALDLFAGAEKQLIAERIGRVFEEGAAIAEANLTTRDGGAIPYYFTGAKIAMDGEPCLVGMGIDVSAQKRASEEFATIFEMSLNPTCIADLNTATFTRINPAFQAVLGYSPAELLGRPFLDFIHPDDIAPTLAVIDEKLKAGVTVIHFENRYRAKDGSYRWFDWVSNPVPERGLTYATAFDVTERRRIEQQLRELNEDLARSNKELEQFAYVASHDLQEPLRMVASYTQLLAQRYEGHLDEKADKYIGYAVDGARRMQGLINDLLAFSRVGTRGGALQPTDARGVVADVLQSLEASIEESAAQIIVGELPTVMADRSQLGQVFQNLIANAIKFRGEKTPRIEVSATRRGRAWEFCVADNGIGIDSQFFDRIFIIFQRLHPRNEYSGSGIGLSIVKKIVERHGGRIRIESAPGEGSRFIFNLPAVSGSQRSHHG